MKIIIENDLSMPLPDDVSVLKIYSIDHIIDRTSKTLTIKAQKISLGELMANILFHDILCYCNYDMEYSALGGAGCDFAIKLSTQKSNI
jgi:hypothetical protein